MTDPRQPGMSGQPLQSPDGPAVPPETGSPFSPYRRRLFPGPARPPGATPPPGRTPGGASAPPASAAASGTRHRAGGGTTGSDRPVAAAESAANGLDGRHWSCGCKIPGRRGSRVDQSDAECRRIRRHYANFGTKAPGSTPIPVRTVVDPAAKRRIPPPRSGASFVQDVLGAASNPTDRSVTAASLEEDTLPARTSGRSQFRHADASSRASETGHRAAAGHGSGLHESGESAGEPTRRGSTRARPGSTLPGQDASARGFAQQHPRQGDRDQPQPLPRRRSARPAA